MQLALVKEEGSEVIRRISFNSIVLVHSALFLFLEFSVVSQTAQQPCFGVEHPCMLMTCPSSPTSVFTDTGAQSADLFNSFGSWSLLQNGSAFSSGAENVAETGLHGTGCFPRVPPANGNHLYFAATRVDKAERTMRHLRIKACGCVSPTIQAAR